jgi:hypothetical protein
MPRLVHRLSITVAAFTVVACGGGGGDGGGGGGTTPPPTQPPPAETPAFSLSLGAPTAAVVAGASTTVTITVTRTGGFTGAVDLTVSGAPTGVTATLQPTQLGGTVTSGVLTIATIAAAPLGSATLTVRATGPGVAERTATLTLTVTAPPPAAGAFSLSATPVGITLQQGQANTVTITVTRTGGFTGALALTATGLPNGVTAAFAPASVTGTTSTLTLTASTGATLGLATFAVRGTATGASEQNVTVTVTVVAPPTGSGGNVRWDFCGSEAPIWLAVQNDNAPWVVVAPQSQGTYRFDITAVRGAVAWVTPDAGGFSTTIYYASREELQTLGLSFCPNTVTKTVNGTVSGVQPTDLVQVALGGAAAAVVPAQGTAFSLSDVPNGPRDLVAARSSVTGGGVATFQLNKVILRREIDPPPGGTLSVLDFASAAEAFDPVSRQLTLANLGSDQASVLVGFQTANGTSATLYSDGGASTATARTYLAVPADRLRPGDLHQVAAVAFAGGGAPTATRTVAYYTGVPQNQTVTFGPALATPTVSAVATTPVARFRTQLAFQTEYNRFYGVQFQQGSGAAARGVALNVTSGWLQTATAFDLTMPDWSGTQAYQAAWGLAAGAPVTWTVFATGWTGGGILAPIADGAVARSATRMGGN